MRIDAQCVIFVLNIYKYLRIPYVLMYKHCWIKCSHSSGFVMVYWFIFNDIKYSRHCSCFAFGYICAVQCMQGQITTKQTHLKSVCLLYSRQEVADKLTYVLSTECRYMWLMLACQLLINLRLNISLSLLFKSKKVTWKRIIKSINTTRTLWRIKSKSLFQYLEDVCF